MNSLVIIVRFNTYPGCADSFEKLVQHNGIETLKKEPSCRQFDIVRIDGIEGEYLLYEVYDSLAAFEEHLQTPHFLEFDKAANDLVASKEVQKGWRLK